MRWGAWLLAAGLAGCDWGGSQSSDPDAGLTVEWRFPLLVSSPASEWTLPSYLAHVTGRSVTDVGRLDVACATVRNDRPAVLNLSLQVQLPVYAQAGSTSLTLASGATAEICDSPIFDFRALYALRSYAPAGVTVTLSTDGTDIASQQLDIAIAPSNEVVFDIPGLSSAAVRDLSVVFVTPDEPIVDQLLRQSYAASVFGGFDSVDPYERDSYTRQVTVPARAEIVDGITLEADEVVTWNVDETDLTILDVSLEHADGRVEAHWSGVKAGDRGGAQPGAGSYRLIWRNGSAQDGTLAWSRSNTHEDVARDALQAVFQAVSDRGARYSNVARSYFDGWQRVRRPAEALEAQAANCLDGSLLFASVLELLGMDPVILYGVGHAYVGVRAAHGSTQVWAIETTGVGTMGPDDAYRIAQDRMAKDKGTADFALTDVTTMRSRGVLPFPQ
jgi:hypothetical protein